MGIFTKYLINATIINIQYSYFIRIMHTITKISVKA